MIAGVILAGGRATRMGGGDKTLLFLAGRPMLAHVIARFQPQVRHLALNANGDAARFASFGLPVLPDTIEGFAGPLAGILAGLGWAATLPGVTHLATVSGDTPFLPLDLVERLADHRPGGIVLAAFEGNRHPTFGLWPLSMRQDLHHFLDEGAERKVTAFTDAMQAGIVDFAVPDSAAALDPFLNVNTPADLAKADALAERLKS